MIWKRALACQMAPAKFDTVAVDFTVGGDDNIFRATGQTLVFPGFYRRLPRGPGRRRRRKTSACPPSRRARSSPSTSSTASSISPSRRRASPKPAWSRRWKSTASAALRLTPASSPRCRIANTCVLDKKRFTPTDVGRVVNKFLTEHFTHYVDYGFTAKLEDELDDISDGKDDWIPVLARFWKDFSAQIGEKEGVAEGRDAGSPRRGPARNAASTSSPSGSASAAASSAAPAIPECDYTRNLDGSGDSARRRQRIELGADPKTKHAIVLLPAPSVRTSSWASRKATRSPSACRCRRTCRPSQATPEIALKLLALPRDLGLHPETGKEGRLRDRSLRSLCQSRRPVQVDPEDENVFDISLERAVALLDEPKSRRPGSAQVLGKHPEDGQSVALYSGKYGPYVKHGKINATIARQGRHRHLLAGGGAGPHRGQVERQSGSSQAPAQTQGQSDEDQVPPARP